jgi:hypothetical protein
VNQTGELSARAVPMPSFELEVHFGALPGCPKASTVFAKVYTTSQTIVLEENEQTIPQPSPKTRKEMRENVEREGAALIDE